MVNSTSKYLLVVQAICGFQEVTTASTGVTDGFSWPAYPSLEYATARPIPSTAPSFAPPFKDLSVLVANRSTTIWASIASPTDSGDKYGNVAWSSLWKGFNVTAPPFTTTASPTEVPKSELAKPTPFPFIDSSIDTASYNFPDNFTYGFAGAALQVEGAVRSEAKGPTVSEQILVARYGSAVGGGPPDVANLNYFLYKQDIARLAAVGVQSYSFSISWARILPFAVPGSPINQEAIDHYDDLIDTVLEYGMTPIVTLNHFDTPLHYFTNTSWQGWDHPEFVDGFVNYAQIVLAHYSDRVGAWITFNEPTTDSSILGNWLSSYNIITAHAKTVHWYRDHINGTAKWSIKLSLSATGFALPRNPANISDVEATTRRLDFAFGYIARPLFLGLPVAESVSNALGPRAPSYTADELAYVKGTCDFFALDIYTVSYHTAPSGGGIDACANDPTHAAFPQCSEWSISRDGWDAGAGGNSDTVTFHQHLRTIFKYLDTTYPSTGGIMVAEFGLSPFKVSNKPVAQQQSDLAPSYFYLPLLNEMLKSHHEDGVKVAGAIGWSFVDNWEWGQYDDHFGVQGFDNATLKRYYKRGIFDFVDFVVAHGGR